MTWFSPLLLCCVCVNVGFVSGASFWNQALTWRIFFASMTATFTLNVLRSTYLTGFGSLSSPGLLNFGSFALATYNLEELPIFMIMGVIGGLIGALFNMINTRLTILRRHHFSKYSMREIERGGGRPRERERIVDKRDSVCCVLHCLFNVTRVLTLTLF